jgi:hypothetical protein
MVKTKASQRVARIGKMRRGFENDWPGEILILNFLVMWENREDILTTDKHG